MNRKQFLSLSASVLAAAWITSDPGFALAQSKSESKSKDSKTTRPDVNESVGGSQSERTTDSQTPLPSKSGSSGTVEQGGGAQGGKGTKQMKDKSVGGSQSERTTDSQTPLPSKSRSSGTVNK